MVGVPAGLAELLPVSQAMTVTGERTRLRVVPPFLYRAEDRPGLKSLATKEGAVGDVAYRTSEPKPAAQAAASLLPYGTPALLGQTYGAGRTAYLASQDTWRWRMADNAGLVAYEIFWERLLVWLCSTAKKRVTAASDGNRYGIGDLVELDLRVLGKDYVPAADARVTCLLTTPAGRVRELTLDPDLHSAGRYEATVTPEEAGEFSLDFQAVLPNETLSCRAQFVAREVGRELDNPLYSEGTLRDVARITGGAFYHYRNAIDPGDLPLSPATPQVETRVYWARQWWVILLLGTALCAEWWCRRRMGLR